MENAAVLQGRSLDIRPSGAVPFIVLDHLHGAPSTAIRALKCRLQQADDVYRAHLPADYDSGREVEWQIAKLFHAQMRSRI